MVFGFDQTSYDAILFVDRNTVVKEMLLTEFEAVLDGVVGEADFAGQTVHAVFLKIDRQLNIVGAVFFLIEFDQQGQADRRWNLPLSQLAETAGYGPELAGKPVRIACRSQCQIPWHQQDLWEPDLSVESNTLKMLAASVKANKLGLIADEAPTAEPPILNTMVDQEQADMRLQESVLGESCIEPQAQDEKNQIIDDAQLLEQEREQERHRMAQNIKKQRQYIASLKTLHQQELEAQRLQFAKDRETFLAANKELQQQTEDVEQRYCELLVAAEAKDEQLKRQQQEHEARLAKVMDQNGIDHQELREQYRRDFQAKLIEQTSKIESQLEMREVEVYYREEQINRLNSEIDTLKQQIDKLQSQTVDKEIQSLVDHGVHFVVTQPGVGPISIASKDLLRFSSDPNAYLAERLGVEQEVYEAWLAHINAPVCLGDLHSGAECGERIEAVKSPQEFVIGVSDRCPVHQHGSLSVANGN